MEACAMVYLNCQDMFFDSPGWMMPLASSGLKTRGTSKDLKVEGLIYCNARISLSI